MNTSDINAVSGKGNFPAPGNVPPGNEGIGSGGGLHDDHEPVTE